ncbi:MAG: ankyrin repeat domain-containing protein [Treponema sp.]|nr:ankyrin repeat domain-containing protein [Treponema sp.]
MNWLVIANNAVKAEELEKKLLLNDSRTVINIIDSGSNAADSTLLLISRADHCIILLNNKNEYTYDISTVIGYFLGKKVPVYTTLEIFPESSRISAFVMYFPTIELLFSHIISNYKKIAGAQSKKESFEYLFKNGIPFTPACFGLFIAKGRLDVCRKYFQAGMNVNVRDGEGTPMLNVATRHEQKECIAWLLDNGADIDAVSADRGYTALMDAVWRGNEEITELLIKRGSKMNTVNKEGQTMLVLAVGAGHENICRMLVEHGENPDVKDSMGMSAYEYANLFKKGNIAGLLKKYHKQQG